MIARAMTSANGPMTPLTVREFEELWADPNILGVNAELSKTTDLNGRVIAMVYPRHLSSWPTSHILHV